MSIHQSPLQIGGTAVLGVAAVRSSLVAAGRGAQGLAFTGADTIGSLVSVGLGLIGTGSILIRRGRGTTVGVGDRLDLDETGPDT